MLRLSAVDEEIAEIIRKETERQANTLELIASENFVSEAVLEAQGCIMTNKYAEGLPGKRYYGGCEFVDEAETLAIERAKQLFGAEFVNVQAHSGSQANMAAYAAVLEPGETFLGMNLSHGGHLTHGSPVNFSGKTYNIVAYGVDKDTETVDFDEVVRQAREHKPKVILVGASAYPRALDFARFREIADEVGAYVISDIAHIAGLIAADLHPDPVPCCHLVTTTTHKTLRGPRGGMVMGKAEFEKAVNKNVFPGLQGGPLMHVIAAKAVAFKEALTDEFNEYQKQIIANAKALAQRLMENGLKLVSGGTDTHLMLMDLRNTELDGRTAQDALEEAGITVNKNTVPFETRKPMVTSGIRIGTPALTTRGMKEPEMELIGDLIARVLKDVEDDKTKKEVRARVAELCAGFPLYAERLETSRI